MFKLKSHIWHYSTAAAIVIAATLLMLILDPWLKMIETPFLLYFGVVPLVALYAGRGAGIFATLLSGLTANYLFIPPTYAFSLSVVGIGRTLVFLLEGILISILVSSLRQAQQQTRESLQQLQTSQTLFQSFMQNSPTTAFIKDSVGRYLYVNSYVERLFNRPASEWVGKTDFDIFSPDLAQQIQGNDQAVLRANQVTQLLETISLNGKDLYYLSFKFPIRDAMGQQLLGGISIDISDRKRAEKALQNSEFRYRSIFETTGVSIWEEDFTQVYEFVKRLKAQSIPDLRAYLNTHPEIVQQAIQLVKIRDVNQQTLQMFGAKTKSELVSSLSSIFVPETTQVFVEEILALAEGRQYYEAETVLRTLQGELRHVLFTVAFPASDKTYEQVLVSLLDITKRKQIEKALRQSEEQLRLVNDRFALAATAVSCLIYDWNVEQDIVERTDGLTQILGYSLEEADSSGIWWRDRVHPDDLQRVQLEAESALRIGDRFTTEYRVLNKENQYVYVIDHGLVVARDANGNPTRVVGTTVNINDRKQAEADRVRLLQQEQAARAEAEAANRVKDEFLAVLSHELRSPLNPILGWSKLLQTRKLDETRTAQALATIERNAKLQSELIEDLLDVSRILQGKLSLKTSPVDLITVTQAAIETVRLAGEAKSISIKTSFGSNVGQVLGDPNRLQQIIWNLLANAVKFTPEGGRVEVRLEKVEMKKERHENEELGTRNEEISQFSISSSQFSFAQLTVTDTGKGIHPDFLPYVFDYFRQADSTTTRKFGGLGLGLAIVRHLVELHGGTVEAESPGEGLGATFIIKLPLIKIDERRQGSTNKSYSVTSQPLQNIHILVVDDDIDTREFVEFMLEQAGAAVLAVATAAEVLAVLASFKPDILLSDVGMPDTDGYTLMRQIRALPPDQGGHTPAIALTAYASEINQQQAIAAGFQQHLSKPVDPEQLIQAIALVHQAGFCPAAMP